METLWKCHAQENPNCCFHSCAEKVEPVIIIHGGAGEIPDDVVKKKLTAVKRAAKLGYKILKLGGTSLDAVEASIRLMEAEPVMNAGYGAVLNIEGEVEADACIMSGEKLDAGGVSIVKDVAHPISLARLVMEKTPHVLLSGDGAIRFAQDIEFPVEPPGSMITNAARRALEAYRSVYVREPACSVGTVGVIAMDESGRIVAGTSSGGTLGKLPGRCSSSSAIGSGLYADDLVGGATATGHGESICKVCLCHTILKEMEDGKNVQLAAKEVLHEMNEKLRKDAGVIAISKAGNIGVECTTKNMPWASVKENMMQFGKDPADVNIFILRV